MPSFGQISKLAPRPLFKVKLCDDKGLLVRNVFFFLPRNIIHGSDSVESAEKEIALWFKNKEDLVDWNPAAYKYVYED